MSENDLEKILKDPHKYFNDIKNANIQNDHKVYDHLNPENHKLEMVPSEKVKTGLFKPIPGKPQHFHVHPLTLKALKKDLFVTDLELSDYALEVPCGKCDQKYDLQFYNHCPHCPK